MHMSFQLFVTLTTAEKMNDSGIPYLSYCALVQVDISLPSSFKLKNAKLRNSFTNCDNEEKFDRISYIPTQGVPNAYSCAKSLKSQSFHPKSHCLGQTCLITAKILKINAYLGVALLLQSYSTAVCSENSRQNGLCLKITLPKLRIT